MRNAIVFIKLNIDVEVLKNGAIKYAEESKETGEQRFYYSSEADTNLLEEYCSKSKSNRQKTLDQCRIVFVLYRRAKPKASSENQVYIHKLLVGTIERIGNDGVSKQIYYKITDEITSPLVIDNFLKFSTLDLVEDFMEDSYISIEDSEPLNRQLSYSLCAASLVTKSSIQYKPKNVEKGLSPFAQRNQYCARIYNAKKPNRHRTEFSRDYDRILYSKAFRRLVDKAQIFSSSKGDHYRTRMTHTLCVAQIARSIARLLHVNEALTEAIAIGHDLGHTPFGHQGERTLEKLLEKTGRHFKHNYQSIRVASLLEEVYPDCPGMDLSIQTLEGMWKHTTIEKNGKLICELEDFLPFDISEDDKKLFYPENPYCSTIEGQIVAIADEIAQRSHDLDDALSAGLLTVEGFLNILKIKKLTSLGKKVKTVQNTIISDQEKGHFFTSEKELMVSRICACVTAHFIDDVVEQFNNTYKKGTSEWNAAIEYFEKHHRVEKKMIMFSQVGKHLNDYLETLVNNMVINSPEVAAFDDMASRVVEGLFNRYYSNPRLLHEGTLQRIYLEMRSRGMKNIIHFQDGDSKLIREEWERIKDPEKACTVRELREIVKSPDYQEKMNYEDFVNTLNKDQKDAANKHKDFLKKEYEKKKIILVRAICDFIAGMTDSYALAEYEKLK